MCQDSGVAYDFDCDQGVSGATPGGRNTDDVNSIANTMVELIELTRFTFQTVGKMGFTKLQTLVPMCVIDKRESGEQSRLGFLVAMWAVRRAGKAQSDHVDCHLRLCTVHAVLKNAQHVRQMCCASLHMQY